MIYTLFIPSKLGITIVKIIIFNLTIAHYLT